MKRRLSALFLLLVPAFAAAQELPQMKFNEVKEIAPGVFFRYSSISATDKTVVFGGSNNIWVVFEDYVVVIDANFPKEAGDVIAAIKKTTDKPIRYVLDTHHHGDHAYGNAVCAKAGATVIAQANCADCCASTGPKEFADGRQGADRPQGHRRQHASRCPTSIFDDKLVLDDGKQRVEFLLLRPRPHGRRRRRLSAQAQDPLHRRCLRQRRLQLHGPLRHRLVDPRAWSRCSSSTSR